MNEFVTIKVNEDIINQIKDKYEPYQITNNGEYISFCASYKGIIITIFDSKHILKSVTFNGEGALKEALQFDENASIKENKENKESKYWINIENQIGSDEVGVGDFLLPMIVVAAFVRKKDIDILKQYGVTDSKKLKDEDILEMGESLANKFFISKLTLSNEKYNEMIDKGENLNSLKAKMHNRALLNLFKKFPDTKYIFIDKFCGVDKYFSYLDDKNETKVTNIVFHEKGETYYPSVALASVLARYSFLLEKQKLEKKYKMTFPFGANKKVDEFASSFIDKYGIDEFNKIAKKNFANYKKILKKEEDLSLL